MTLVEIMVSLVLGTVLIGIVVGAWYSAYRNWTLDRIRTKLRVDLEIATERLKSELRLSSATYASFYKAVGDSEYSAISFPMVTADANGFFDLDADGLINWDKSIIYHTFLNPSTGYLELRRTEFTDNHSALINESQRETQLLNAVTNGDGSGGPNQANTATITVIKQISSFNIDPKTQEFDGYSSSQKKSDNVNFGSVKLTPGYHEFTFQVTGMNSLSSGCKLGVDTLSINPSGCQQEMEVYAPYASSGDGSSKEGPNVLWSGNNFREYSSDSIGDFVTFRIYYDSWLETNFDNSVRENTILTSSDLCIALPDLEEGSEVVWTGEVGAGSANGDGVKADFPIQLGGVTIRNIISSSNIDSDGNLVRIKFEAHSAQPLTITEAYLDQRSSDEDSVDPAITTTPGTTRTKLYFTDDAGGISGGITILAGGEVFSNWTIFPISVANDYFVTFYVSGASYPKYWAGTEPTDVNSYLIGGNYASQASWPLPASHDAPMPPGADQCVSSANVYAQSSMEIWSQSGSVTTQVYDTKVTSPSYSSLTWSDSGSGVAVYGRSSSDPLMSGASWSVGAVSGSNRYVQAKAELSTVPFWTCVDHTGTNVSDENYKNSGIITCPTCAKFLVPGTDTPWVDNILATWPGNSRMCDVSGYFAQDSDYGVIKLLVDGEELTKGIEFEIVVCDDSQDTLYETSIIAEVNPRNTGK